jgi:hypothetical protein
MNGVIEALATTGVFTAKITEIVDASDRKMTAPYEGCGHVSRIRQMADKHGQGYEIEVAVYGWQMLVLIDTHTKMPLAATAVPIHDHEALSMRALVAQVQTNLADYTRLQKSLFDREFLVGVDWWWLDQHGLLFVVPAKENLTVAAHGRAQAAAGEGVTVGRRSHTVRHGQGSTEWSEWLETEGVGSTALTTDDQYGMPEHGCQQHRSWVNLMSELQRKI